MFSHPKTASAQGLIVNAVNSLIAGVVFLTATTNFNSLSNFNDNRYFTLTVVLIGEIIKYTWQSYAEKKGSVFNSTLGNVRLKQIPKAILLLGGSVVTFTFTFMIFGAPVMSNHVETITAAVLVTEISVLPGVLAIGAKDTLQLLMRNKTDFKKTLKIPQYHLNFLECNLFCCLAGLWLGAFVIPLDWNRPWQEWPLPCTFGALVGYFLAHLFTVVIQAISLAPKSGLCRNFFEI